MVKSLKGLAERRQWGPFRPKRVVLSRSRAGTFLIFLFMLLMSVFMLLPVFYAVLQAFKPLDELFAFPPRFFVRNPTLENFRQILTLSDNLWVPFTRYLFNTVLIAVVGTTAYVVLSSMAAYPLAKGKVPGMALVSGLIVWALLFNESVTQLPTYLVVSGLKLTDTYLAILLPPLAGTMGVFLVRQFIVASIPDSTLEAARIDGASEYRIFFSVVMPSIKPAWVTIVIFSFQIFWQTNPTNYVYSENLKQLQTVLSTVAASGIARQGAFYAVSVVMMVPPVIVFLLSQRSVNETMAHSGMK